MTLSTHDKLSPANAATVRHALRIKGAALHDGESVTLADALQAAESVVPCEAPRTEPWAIERQRQASVRSYSVSGPSRWQQLHDDMDRACESIGQSVETAQPVRLVPYSAQRESNVAYGVAIGLGVCFVTYLAAMVALIIILGTGWL